MKHVSATLCLFLCLVPIHLAAAGPRPGDHVISRSDGGVVGHYMALADSHSRVVIDGPCYSACAWMFTSKRNVCWTPNARFAFHMLTYKGADNLGGTGWLAADVRKGLQRYAYATANTRDLVHVPSATVQSVYPDRRC
jgi:hypothetical protein